MIRLYTDDLHVGYGERLIVKGLSVEIPDKKLQRLSAQMAVVNPPY